MRVNSMDLTVPTAGSVFMIRQIDQLVRVVQITGLALPDHEQLSLQGYHLSRRHI